MAAWPFIFLRRDKEFTEVDIRHESIHGRQQVEMLLVFFYVAYLICWLIALARKWRENPHDLECIEHDQLIEAVKEELTAMGII